MSVAAKEANSSSYRVCSKRRVRKGGTCPQSLVFARCVIPDNSDLMRLLVSQFSWELKAQ